MKSRTTTWALVLNLILLGMGSRAGDPPFKLTPVENQDYRDWKREELMARLGITATEVDAYRCNGKREYELLPELRRANAAGDSLRVRLYEADAETGSPEDLIYKEGVLYKRNGKKAGAGMRSNVFVKHAEEALAKLAALPTGKILLDRLQHSPYPLVIRYGSPHFWAMSDANRADSERSGSGMDMATAVQYLVTLRKPDYDFQFDRVGTGGFIDYDPKFTSEFIESDGQKRPAQAHVILAHEMFHAFDGIRGMFDRRFVDGEAYEITEAMEHRGTFMENRIREESGLFFRKYYGKEEGKASLLGEDGKPMLIPTPCIQ